mmetsp:Transcript_126528/g.319545  ORF Transcript_126528/g.319545 Transcript_126528/m.319545 type:complete len:818 (-) Transcript_126528:39-2492(-)
MAAHSASSSAFLAAPASLHPAAAPLPSVQISAAGEAATEAQLSGLRGAAVADASKPLSATVTLGLAAPMLAAAAIVAHRPYRRRSAKAASKKARCVAVNAAAGAAEADGPPKRGYFPPRATPILDSMNDEGTASMRRMTVEQLKELAEEVRWQVLDAVSVTGGHLGAGLGVTDLTVALHAVYDTPRDEICWDVAHQCQPHKVLTGRRGRIYTLRQGGGLAGFAKRTESEYDAFGAGHSTTSISAAVGFETARNRQGKKGHSIAVIGDGAITGGMAWEAMNHAGGMRSKIVVVLNDNGQVSLPTFYNKVQMPVGALSETLAGTQMSNRGLQIQDNIAKIETSEGFQRARELAKQASKTLLPDQLSSAAAKLDEYTRDFVKTVPFQGSGSGSKGELFEQLGFYYVGPIDGNNMETLVEVLKNIKQQHEDGRINKPVFLHIKTKKGNGYEPAQRASDKLHAVKPKFNLPKTPSDTPQTPPPPPLTKVFADALVKEAEADDKICAITAAMPGGTGIGIFEKRFGPERTFDVGIAEQHAVTFAAGLAAGGLKPFCSIYSTFLQRGYDQLVHDVALQKLPVRFILDRAGLVGEDGPTHGGTFDLSFMGCIPDMLICASADEAELVNMVHTIAKIDDYPTALRYPRGNAYGDLELPSEPRFLEPGKGRISREGRDGTIAILSVGSRLRECLKAAERLEQFGISATVADARWVKPLDEKLVSWLAKDHKAMITVEENSIGGFSAQVQQSLLEAGHLDGVGRTPLVFRSMMFPDRWIDHDKPEKQYEDAELNASHIVAKALSTLARAGVKVAAPQDQDSLLRVAAP